MYVCVQANREKASDLCSAHHPSAGTDIRERDDYCMAALMSVGWKDHWYILEEWKGSRALARNLDGLLAR